MSTTTLTTVSANKRSYEFAQGIAKSIYSNVINVIKSKESYQSLNSKNNNRCGHTKKSMNDAESDETIIRANSEVHEPKAEVTNDENLKGFTVYQEFVEGVDSTDIDSGVVYINDIKNIDQRLFKHFDITEHFYNRRDICTISQFNGYLHSLIPEIEKLNNQDKCDYTFGISSYIDINNFILSSMTNGCPDWRVSIVVENGIFAIVKH